jgi:hypothetical protein
MKMIRVATFAGPGTSPVIHEVAHPVTIRRQKRDVAVVLSVAEYEKLTRLNVEEFEADRPRIVIDTNVLVSRLLLPGSVPAEAVRVAAN